MTVKPTRDRVNPEKINTTPKRRPSWIVVEQPSGETYTWLQGFNAAKRITHGL